VTKLINGDDNDSSVLWSSAYCPSFMTVWHLGIHNVHYFLMERMKTCSHYLKLQSPHSRSHRPIEQHFSRPWIPGCYLFTVSNSGLLFRNPPCAVTRFPNFTFIISWIGAF